MYEVRPFARHDRDGLTALVNQHVAAVLPGGAIPVSVLLSKIERDTTEPLLDPWVVDRHTIVGVERDRVVAAAHLKRYGTDDRVSESYQDRGEIDWFVSLPHGSHFTRSAHTATGAAVLESAIAQLRAWDCREWGADGNLPCLGVYGIPDSWP